MSSFSESDTRSLAIVLSKLEAEIANVSIDTKPILSIENVSCLLHCSIDTVRRIPRSELPAYRVGKSNLYLKEDVIKFVRSKPANDPMRGDTTTSFVNEDFDIEAVIQSVLDSNQVDVREPSKRRAK